MTQSECVIQAGGGRPTTPVSTKTLDILVLIDSKACQNTKKLSITLKKSSMPIDPITAGLGSQGINAIANIFTNNQNRGWDIAWDKINRNRALKDWNMVNEYNSPQAQMQRFKDADLNPNLIYGQGTDAAPVRQTQQSSSPAVAPRFDFSGPMMLSQDLELKKAQVDNVKAQTTLAYDESLVKKAQVIATLTSAEKTNLDRLAAEFALDLNRELRGTQVSAANLSVEKQKADIQYTLDNNERAAAAQSSSLREAVERILSMRATRANTQAEKDVIHQRLIELQKSNELKQLDIDLKKNGIQPSDPIYLRALGRLLNDSTWKQIPGQIQYPPREQEAIKGTRPRYTPKRRR